MWLRGQVFRGYGKLAFLSRISLTAVVLSTNTLQRSQTYRQVETSSKSDMYRNIFSIILAGSFLLICGGLPAMPLLICSHRNPSLRQSLLLFEQRLRSLFVECIASLFPSDSPLS
ncbi:hypothetical protein ABW19_dt0201584 [Dactylella cylindrospora]|nr:hypothetical protein ABW19_dt0201584 [Dactylella cylindrospora]